MSINEVGVIGNSITMIMSNDNSTRKEGEN